MIKSKGVTTKFIRFHLCGYHAGRKMTDFNEDDVMPSDPTETVFTPQRQNIIFFRGRNIVTALLNDQQGYVSLRSLADAFKVNRGALTNRLKRKADYFSPYVCRIYIMTTGGMQPHLCMNANAVPLFMATTSLESVKDLESRDVLRLFIEECHKVLAEHFSITEAGEMEVIKNTVSRLVLEREAEEGGLEGRDVRIYVDKKMAEIQHTHEIKIGEVRKAFGDLRGELRSLTSSSNVPRLTPEQVGQISNTVKTLGFMFQERGIANPYQRIYGNLFRLCGVGDTARIRQSDFESSMEWLEQQITRLSQAARLSKDQQDDLMDQLLPKNQ